MLVYLASIFSGLFFGVTESINKNITEHKFSALSYAFLQYLSIALVYSIPAILYFQLPSLGITYLYLSISIIITLIANTMTIKAYKTEDISSITVFSPLSMVVAFLAGVILLQEAVNLFKITGVIAIVLGSVVIFYEGKRLHFSSGLVIALLGKIIWGFQPLFDKLTLQSFNLVTYTVLGFGASSLILSFFNRTRDDAKKIFAKHKKKFLLGRVFVIAGLFLYLWSIKRGNVSIVNTNTDTLFLLSTVFIGIFFLKERQNVAKKLIGSSLCILGIILLNFF